MQLPSASTSFAVAALHEMAAAKIQLEKLIMPSLKFNRNANKFVDAVSQLKSLESLEIQLMQGLTDVHRIDVVKRLVKLTSLDIGPDFIPTPETCPS